MNKRHTLLSQIAPPACLVLALFLFIAAFALMAVEQPQPGIELHRARIENNEQRTERLEQQLQQRRLKRKVLIGSLFGLAAVSATVAFLVMRPKAG